MLTVVVPIRNRSHDLNNCLRSIDAAAKHSGLAIEVLVVDDRSSEDLSTVVDQYADAMLLTSPGVGPGAARKHGFKQARADVVCFVDSDCEVAPDWLSAIRNLFSDQDVIALQGNPCLFMKRQNERLGSCEEILYTRLFETYIHGETCRQIDTRNCVFRKSALIQHINELFVTSMKAAQAEARVCGNAMAELGILINYSPDVRVFHKDPPSLLASIRQKFRHGSGRVHVWPRLPKLTYILSRYFALPILRWGVPFWYVIPVHSAFLAGYLFSRAKSARPKTVFQSTSKEVSGYEDC